MTANLTTTNAPAFQPAIPWAPVPAIPWAPVDPIEVAGQPLEIDLDAYQPANEVAAACEPVVPRPSRADCYHSELDELEAEADAFVERELEAQDEAINRHVEAKHALELEAIAERVRAECSDSAVTLNCCIVTEQDGDTANDHRHRILIDDTFAEDFKEGGARYAILSCLVRELYAHTLPHCDECGCEDPGICGGCDVYIPLWAVDPVEAAANALDNIADRAD